MRASVLQKQADVSRQPLTRRDLPDPEPGRGQVRVAVKACGVCRTDLHIVEGDLEPHAMPVVPGHMIIGEVDAVGDDCEMRQVGDRVGVGWLGWTCGECRFCRSGRENLCRAAKFTGYDFHGGYADYTLADEAFTYAIPDAFDDVHAAPLMCAGIIGYRSLQRANVPDGGRLGLYGFGSAAHLIMQIVQNRGYETYVVTRSENHQRMAWEMGAAWVGDDATRLPELMDAAVIFAPAGKLVPLALEKLERGGTLSLAGIHMSPVPEIDYREHLYHERDVRSAMNNTRADAEHLLAEAAEAGVKPRVKTYDLADANRALDDLKHSRLDGTPAITLDH